MILTFLSVFADVVAPVFALVLVAYLAGPRLSLDGRTLSRAAYYLFIPAFVFEVIRRFEGDVSAAFRMVVYIAVVHGILALAGWSVARLLKRPPEVVAAYVLIAVFGNIGNFGLSLIEFRLGEAALGAGTVYFLAIMTVAFVIGVTTAARVRGGSMGAALAVFRTPPILAILPAVLFRVTGLPVPPVIGRMTGLLGQAMIPVMLVVLGLQLAESGRPRITADVWTAGAVRLLAGPLIAAVLAVPFGMAGVERAAGIMQAGMPVAVMTTIIALEYNTAPAFVTHTILFSTAASLFTLTVVLSLV